MNIVVIKSPKFLSGILRTLFGIKKQADWYIKKNCKKKDGISRLFCTGVRCVWCYCLPCVKGDSSQCEEMSRSDWGIFKLVFMFCGKRERGGNSATKRENLKLSITHYELWICFYCNLSMGDSLRDKASASPNFTKSGIIKGSTHQPRTAPNATVPFALV